MTFSDYFQELWGYEPFPWQIRLAQEVCDRSWPSSIGLPTAAGKTALIDIAVFLLASKASSAARRIFFIVDRRVIVDEATERAQRIATKLSSAEPGSLLFEVSQRLRQLGGEEIPLAVSSLRGGIARDDSWALSPIQPAVVCSTVDQVGSSLLFQSYGVRNYQWSMRAGLVAADSLLILDEAHTSQPFAETLANIRILSRQAEYSFLRPLTALEVSATPREGLAFRENEADLSHPVLKRRWTAQKRTRLADKVEDREFLESMVAEAERLAAEPGVYVVGIIVNRVRTAREIFEQLRSKPEARAVLLTGRARPYDRDEIWKREKPILRADREIVPDRTVFVVATQCIEVGADISFDALVTEIASIDALEQRFGRLDRTGEREMVNAVIVARKEQVKATAVDPVYGSTLSSTWQWLESKQVTEKTEIIDLALGRKKTQIRQISETFVEMGVHAIRKALAQTDTEQRDSMTMPREHAPILTPAHLDILCQTSPEPHVGPDVALYLHGPRSGPADIEVIWRADLGEDPREWPQIVAACPPSAMESLAIPLWAARKWLVSGADCIGELSDIEGIAEPDLKSSHDSVCRHFLNWQGPAESEVHDATDDLRPGMRIVVPARYGGCDEWGWNPKFAETVRDIGDPVKLAASRPLLRVHRDVASQWGYSALAAALRAAETPSDVMKVLVDGLKGETGWVLDVVRKLSRSRRLQSVAIGRSVVAFVGRGFYEQDSHYAQFTGEVKLSEHLDRVAAWTARFSSQLPAHLCATVTRAAELHDIGKADPRFQAMLRGGIPSFGQDLLAKSRRNGHDVEAIERARLKAGYPRGCRHELMSVALLQGRHDDFKGLDFDLLQQLIASHHGRCRPFAPVVIEDNRVEVEFGPWKADSNHNLASLGSGICERFWRLNSRYGWFGLAYLETILRLADWRASEEEQQDA